MNKEVLFAKKLEEVRRLAKEQGNCVSEEQVQEAFKELDFGGEQLQMVYDYLVKHKVGIGKPLDEEDYLTDEEKNYLDNYLESLNELKEYTKGEREAFIIGAMSKDEYMRGMLIESFLKDVVDIAKIYTGQGVLLEDLIGEGNLALTLGSSLLSSAENAEEAEGMLIKTIMDRMEELVAEQESADKTEKKIEDRVNKVNDKAKELYDDLLRKITVSELAKEMGLTETYIRETVKMSGRKIEYIEDENE
ncbi:MAG: hypothetical protein J6033_03130 [Lachnospiraceae bacterium]|nr:hypothetical protein [Lachnospiraceae bacterium]